MATKKSKQNETPEVELWQLDKIFPYEKNAKIHTPEQIDTLSAIITKDGFRRPISIDENGVIIAGHGRRLAALQLGYKKIPVIVERGLTEAQKDAARISDNMVGRGDYDENLLGEEVMRLSSLDDFDISTLGMGELELGDIFEKFVLEELVIEDEPGDVDSDGQPLPEKKNHDVVYEKSYAVIIDCSGEDEQRELYEKLIADGRKCKIQTM